MSDLEYAEGYWIESFGSHGPLGIRIMVALGRDLTDIDKNKLAAAARKIEGDLMAETIRLDPRERERSTREREELLGLFPCSIFAEEIPNGYCDRWCCKHLPWFIVTTPVGRIKIGWRKRVIAIDWSGTTVRETANELFPNEDVTKGNDYIHACGLDKARKYVAALLDQGDPTTAPAKQKRIG